MNVISPILPPAFFEHVYQGAQRGAAYGTFAGIGLVAFVEGVGAAFNIVETTNRALGGTPKWPMNDKDCELPQFRNMPGGCLSNPLFHSYFSFVVYTVGATALTGTVIGAVKGAVRSFFSEFHRD